MDDNIIEHIKSHAQNRVNKMIESLSLLQKQIIIGELVRHVDFKFNQLSRCDEDTSIEITNGINLFFPVAFRNLYTSFSEVDRFPLMPSTIETMNSTRKFISLCTLIANLENYQNLLRVGLLQYQQEGKTGYLTYTNRYPHNERYERIQSIRYSNAMLIAQAEKYGDLIRKLPSIIKTMEKLVYVWNNDFIGYDADPIVDKFYTDNAVCDFAQAVDWNIFDPNTIIGGIEYGRYISAAINYESFCLKHLQFCEIARRHNPTIQLYNILPCLKTIDKIQNTFEYITGLDEEIALKIFDAMTYDETKKDYYSKIGQYFLHLLKSHHNTISAHTQDVYIGL